MELTLRAAHKLVQKIDHKTWTAIVCRDLNLDLCWLFVDPCLEQTLFVVKGM